MTRILVTGANGQLGRLVINQLLQTIPAGNILAAVRTPAKAEDLAKLGIEVREADYDRPETLDRAFTGVEKILLISSSEVGKRAPQHKAVIAAAKKAGVKFLAYTSILHADTSPLGLAGEHLETEAALKASGIPFALLRNGWYTENYTASIPPALEHGAFLGSAKDGRISSAARKDYADAAAAVLTSKENQAGKVYELAGDDSYSLAEFAAEIARQAGKPVVYSDLPQKEYEKILLSAGLPDFLADLLADSDAGAAKGGLFDDSKTLSTVIGRPTTPYAKSIADALKV